MAAWLHGCVATRLQVRVDDAVEMAQVLAAALDLGDGTSALPYLQGHLYRCACADGHITRAHTV